eukprot:8206398-Pyramimonas_sp.AAC.2
MGIHADVMGHYTTVTGIPADVKSAHVGVMGVHGADATGISANVKCAHAGVANDETGVLEIRADVKGTGGCGCKGHRRRRGRLGVEEQHPPTLGHVQHGAPLGGASWRGGGGHRAAPAGASVRRHAVQDPLGTRRETGRQRPGYPVVGVGDRGTPSWA